MKKGWIIILVHLLIQLVSGWLIITSFGQEFSGPLSGLAELIVYLSTAAGFALLALLLFVFQKKGTPVRRTFQIAFLWTVVLWGTFPIYYASVSQVILDRENAAAEEESILRLKKASLTVAATLVSKTYSWNPQTKICDIEFPDGKQSSFNLDNGRFYILVPFTPPPSKDTMAWLRLLKDNAKYYITETLQFQFDSLVNIKNYSFSNYGGEPNQIKLGIYPLGDRLNPNQYLQADYFPIDHVGILNLVVPSNMRPFRSEKSMEVK